MLRYACNKCGGLVFIPAAGVLTMGIYQRTAREIGTVSAPRPGVTLWNGNVRPHRRVGLHLTQAQHKPKDAIIPKQCLSSPPPSPTEPAMQDVETELITDAEEGTGSEPSIAGVKSAGLCEVLQNVLASKRRDKGCPSSLSEDANVKELLRGMA
ncbi:hypothetical protein BC827DRAFT_1158024 [Russula dissimulans]|nr:hypothetical protein BC827DRAFT_1158024 [Russula dissimulans]